MAELEYAPSTQGSADLCFGASGALARLEQTRAVIIAATRAIVTTPVRIVSSWRYSLSEGSGMAMIVSGPAKSADYGTAQDGTGHPIAPIAARSPRTGGGL